VENFLGLPCHDFQWHAEAEPVGGETAPATTQITPSATANGTSSSASGSGGATAGAEVVVRLRERPPQSLWARLTRLVAPVGTLVAAIPTALLGSSGSGSGGGERWGDAWRGAQCRWGVGVGCLWGSSWVPPEPGIPGLGDGRTGASSRASARLQAEVIGTPPSPPATSTTATAFAPTVPVISSSGPHGPRPELRAALVALYRPQVERLRANLGALPREWLIV